MTGIAFAAVAATRGGRLLFEDLTFALPPGGAALVTGPNGVGKSSLLRIAAGLSRPAAGNVVRDGAIALLGDAHALDTERTLARALAFWIGPRAPDALAAVGLAAIADLPVRMLSTGQRRRAGLALVLGTQAPIWLLDEPANGLDADGAAMLDGLIAAHRAAGGIVMIATHQPVALPDAVSIALDR